jgi:hypothetical protein
MHGKEAEKVSPPFNFENEMSKIKIYIPFNELIKKGEYQEQIIKMIKMGETADTLNIEDDHPATLFGPCVEEMNDTEYVLPFYVSLKVHDMTLHNAMLDSGASHNIMPKVIMDKLGLDITRPYKDIFFLIDESQMFGSHQRLGHVTGPNSFKEHGRGRYNP